MAYATGDDLNPPIRGHGYTAPIVARGLWIYRDSRKNGSGRTAHNDEGEQYVFNTNKKGRCVRHHEKSN